MRHPPVSRTVFVILLASTASARAAVTINHQPAGPSNEYQVQYPHQTRSVMTIEFTNGDQLVETRTCTIICNNTPPAATWTDVGYILTLDPYEELVSENCTGTILGVGRCSNGNYTVALRPRIGNLNTRRVGNDGLTVSFISDSTRYWFGPDKYWDRSSVGTVFPAGVYEAEFSGVALSNCNPVPTSERFQVTVVPAPDVSPETTFTFDGTVCEYTFDNQSGRDVTVTSDVGSCDAPADGTCTIDVPWRASTLFTGSSGAGYTVQFNHNEEPCSLTGPDRSQCREDKANRDYADIDISVLDNATAPALIASVGSAPPADRTAAKGEQRVVIAHMHVEPRNGPATMQVLYVSVSGSSDPNADIERIRVFDDANNDGLVTSGETQVGSQVMAVTGTSFVTLNTAVSAPRNFVITADIADELAAAASIPFAPWTLFLVAAFPIVVLYRRRRLALGLAASMLIVGTMYCGADDGGQQETDEDQQEADDDTLSDDDDGDTLAGDSGGEGDGGDDAGAGGDTGGGDSGGGDIDPPPGAAVFEFRVDGFTVPAGTILEGIPVDGATITVPR